MSSRATFAAKKRERTQNWLPEEKRVLFELIKNHITAIENKKIDALATAHKIHAWRQIYCDFKGKFSTERDVSRIREQWRRIKAQSRVDVDIFTKKVKSKGIEEAFKSQPSTLSIEVWRLLQYLKKNGDDASSDESRVETGIPNLKEILKSLSTQGAVEISSSQFVKRECDVEVDDGKKEVGRMEESDEEFTNSFGGKKMKISPDGIKVIEGNEGKTLVSEDEVDGKVPNTVWDFNTAQEEHQIKLKILSIEMERADLRKQAAINELKTSEVKKHLMESQAIEYFSQVRMSGEAGSGAGKGGGGGGSIRSAGGSFGKMEVAQEDQYFYNKQKEQIANIREGLHDEISFHEEQIKRHQEAINRHKQRIGDMEKK